MLSLCTSECGSATDVGASKTDVLVNVAGALTLESSNITATSRNRHIVV